MSPKSLRTTPAAWCAIEPRTNYPYLTQTVWRGRKEDRDDELHVGAMKVFAAAGFREVLHPSKRRYVMRIDFNA